LYILDPSMKTKIQKLVNVAKKHQDTFTSTIKDFTKVAKLQLEDLQREIKDIVVGAGIEPVSVTEPPLAQSAEEWDRLSSKEKNERLQTVLDFHKENQKLEKQKEQENHVPKLKSVIRENGEVILFDTIEDIKLVLPQIKLMPMKRSMLAWEKIAKKDFPDLSPGIKKHVDKVMNYDDVYVEVTPEEYWGSPEWAKRQKVEKKFW